ncbi:helix-turn-helix domain-containing protein [Okeania sp. SIO3I5]|uniref:helix-turn-helix domain-containing protein n=1 Tax=Okeania sp. SIO3I5 TaxID=2607805 RepID=UPI0025E35CF6|nr:helix-turn-helix transcriptional regulator [Okeania sp. SIO3I5]
MMSDVKKYIEKRKQIDPEFTEGFESGYASFKIGVILAQAREETGMTIEELASRLNWNKSTIFQIENNSSDVSISILEKYAREVVQQLIIRHLRKLKIESILIQKLSITSHYCLLYVPCSLFSGEVY